MKVKGLLELASRYRNIVFDLDGVLWQGTRAFPASLQAHRALRERGCRLFYLTNNSSRHVKTVHRKLTSLGY
jgi:ribonucleotide monophosphatase NagD (HAD superfamily)